jgi:hypothetical protein
MRDSGSVKACCEFKFLDTCRLLFRTCVLYNGRCGEAPGVVGLGVGAVPQPPQLLPEFSSHWSVAWDSFLAASVLGHKEVSQAAPGSEWLPHLGLPAFYGGQATLHVGQIGTEIWACDVHPNGFI